MLQGCHIDLRDNRKGKNGPPKSSKCQQDPNYNERYKNAVSKEIMI